MKKVIFALIFVLLTFTGCYNYADVEDVVVVAGMAFDKNENGYSVVAETIAPGSSSEASVKSETVSSEGKTVFEAMEGLKNASGKPFDFSHCQVIFVGEKTAENGISEILDMVFHYNTLRLTVLFVTVGGGLSSTVFDCELPLYDIVSYGIFDMMKQDNPGSAVYPSAQAYACLNTLENKGKDLILPRLSINDKEIFYSGMTVFRDDRAVGNISSETARRYLTLMGKLAGGDMTLSVGGEYVSFEIRDISTESRIETYPDAFETKVKIKAAARQLPENCDLSDPKCKEYLQKETERVIEEELSETFDEIKRNFRSDVFAFGNMIYRKMPSEWENIKDGWRDVFSAASLEIVCECEIIDSGRTPQNAVSGR